MGNDRGMGDEPLPSGWLPPRPTTHPTTEAPSRAPGEWPRRPPPRPPEPASPLALGAIVCGSVAIVLLLLSAGVAFLMAAALAALGWAMAMRVRRRMRAGAPGREGQVKAALVVCVTALALSLVAGIVWVILSANGVTPQDLQEWLEREMDRLRQTR